MITYVMTPLSEIVTAIQGKRVAGIHLNENELQNGLAIELEAFEDEDGVIQCDALSIQPYIDKDGCAQLRIDFIGNPV